MDKMLHLTLFGYFLAAGGVKRTSMNIRGGTSMVTDYELVFAPCRILTNCGVIKGLCFQTEKLELFSGPDLQKNKTKTQFMALEGVYESIQSKLFRSLRWITQKQ